MSKEPGVTLLLRALTAVMKALTDKAAFSRLGAYMESLGDVGYIESISPLDIEKNIAQLYCDIYALSVSEGTKDIVADDTVSALKGQGGAEVIEALKKWVGAAVEQWRSTDNVDEAYIRILWKVWWRWVSNVIIKEVQELSLLGWKLMEGLGRVVCAMFIGGRCSEGKKRVWWW
ncbi:MAG: hypothetical protein ALECFALPRED_001252 [Alectoria fallacina]|uniref:Uncharacterized protein n=1 Tax=Alectoria fallacina TaxID=1903189 RepID=A0A8H3IG86_9LECA|nr:MAG: hypothetical protein ALECFALPRED_001252 [Alectoria fallacina]